jgi:uncharacterized protein YjbI with pentapeptide repeats
MRKRLGWRGLIIGLVLGGAVGGGIAWAAIPDSTTGAITACYPTSGTNKGVLRVIDYQVGARCAAGEATLTWQQGSVCNSFPHPNVNLAKPGSAPGGGCNFNGAYFYAQNLSSAILTNANLTASNLRYANLSGATLTGVNLTGAKLWGAYAGGVDLTNANLTNAVLDCRPALKHGGSCTPGAVLNNVKGLTSAQLRSIGKDANNLFCGVTSRPSMFLTTLTNTNLSGFDLSSFDVIDATLSNDVMTGVNLSKAEANNANFTNSNLTNANFTCTDLGNATMTGATLTGAIWSNTTCPDNTNSDDHASTCIGHL